MNIIALDDELGALKLLKQALKESFPNDNIMAFNYGNDMINYCKNISVDIAFLDIMVGDVSGLEIAKILKKYNPYVNIIFVTGYSDYGKEAVNLHASGYIMKPVSKEDIIKEYNDLLYPVKQSYKSIRIRTFGNFEVFINNKPISFQRKKAKELLAILIDKNGSSCTRKELIAYLFEDNCLDLSVQNYFSKIWKTLVETFKAYNFDNIVGKNHDGYFFIGDNTYVDSFEFLKGNPLEINNFHGKYMSQYSWSEFCISKFYN